MSDPLLDRQRVYALAEHLLDWIPDPKTSTGQLVAAGNTVREGASVEERACPACQGQGKRRIRGVFQACDRCNASGRERVDAYTRRQLAPAAEYGSVAEEIKADLEFAGRDPSTAGWLRSERRRRHDELLERIARDQAQASGVDDPDWWLSAALRRQDVQFSRGSWPELVGVLRVLETVNPAAHSLFWRLVVQAQDVRPSDTVRARLDEIADWLAERMRKPIRLPAELDPQGRRDELRPAGRGRWANTAAQQQRDALIAGMASQGLQPAEIALRVGVTAARVRQILRANEWVATGPQAA